ARPAPPSSGSITSTSSPTSTPPSSRSPSGARPRSRSPSPAGALPPTPRPAWSPPPAPAAAPDMWARPVRWFRAAPGAILEPWAGATVCSAETVHAIRAEVPGLRLLVDTGHVSDWGGDPLELLEFADHVQLRQGRPGSTQLHVDDPTGVVDFAAVLARLDALGYRGRLSVEYFDLPEYGWPLDDPLAWADALARHVRALM